MCGRILYSLPFMGVPAIHGWKISIVGMQHLYFTAGRFEMHLTVLKLCTFQAPPSNQRRSTPICMTLLRNAYLLSPLGTRELFPTYHWLGTSTLFILAFWPNFKGALRTVLCGVSSGTSDPHKRLLEWDLSYRKVKRIVDLYALSADHHVSLLQQPIISKDINHSSIVITFCHRNRSYSMQCHRRREDREAVQAIDLSGLGFELQPWSLCILRCDWNT